MAVLPKNVRLEKLRALRDDSTKIIGKQKLYYKEESEQHAIYKVDLSWLIYNEHNGRLESEMLTWKGYPPSHFCNSIPIPRKSIMRRTA